MLPKTHLILSTILSLTLYFLFGITFLQGLAIIFGGFFIDTDHYLWYVYNKKDWNLKRSIDWHMNLYATKPKRIFLHIFHTIESFGLIFILGFFYSLFWYILLGMIFHLTLDIIKSYQNRFYGKRISIFDFA